MILIFGMFIRNFFLLSSSFTSVSNLLLLEKGISDSSLFLEMEVEKLYCAISF